MRHAFVLLASLSFVPLTSATAQVPVRPGAQVRVTGHFCHPFHTCQHSVSTFVAWKADSLVIQSNGDTLTVPVTLLTRLDVSRGRKTNTGEGAGIGFLLGVFAGAAIGLASYECEPCFIDLGPGTYAAAGAVIGGLGGLVVGALIGSAIETDRWMEMRVASMRVSVAPQRDGRFALGLSVRF